MSRDELAAGIPMGRRANVEDVARAALFFASDLSAFVTSEPSCRRRHERLNEARERRRDTSMNGELPLSKNGAPWRSGWGVFDKDSELGTLELLTPERRRAAAALVEEGVTVNLDHPLDIPLEIFDFRPKFKQNVFEIIPGYLDETLDAGRFRAATHESRMKATACQISGWLLQRSC